MEVYVRDYTFGELAVLDEYESFIWTERYSDHGELEIVTPSTRHLKALLKPGRYIQNSNSSRLMHIDKVLDAENEQGERKLTVTGSSLEKRLLQYRAVGPNRDGPDLTIRGTYSDVIARLIQKICVNGEDIYSLDEYPAFSVTNGVTSKGEAVDIAIQPKSLYDAIKELADADKLGFRIFFYDEEPRFRFNVFRGRDRKQVSFSSQLDNLTEESYLESWEDYYNTAYVWVGDKTRLTVYAPGMSKNPTGVARRILTVVADDIDPLDYETTAALQKVMTERGKKELAKHNKLNLFDGKLTHVNPYVYGKDYYLGDTVTLLGDGKQMTENVVTEFIWAHDQEGLRSYPTFSTKEEQE